MDPSQPRRRRPFVLILVVLAVIFFVGRTVLSYYVDVLWFRSLGYGDVFWKTLSLHWEVFTAFAAVTFLILYGSFLSLKRAHVPDLPDGHTILIGGRPLKLPVGPVLRVIALGISLVVAAAAGAAMMAEWPTLALFWYAPHITGGVVDPIFGKPLNFFLFTLPAWQVLLGWLLTLTLIIGAVAIFFLLITGGARMLAGRLSRHVTLPWRSFSITFGFLLLILAAYAYISRFERLLDDHTIFGGVTYTDAHIILTGMLVVSATLVLGALIAFVNGVRVPRGRWLIAAVLPSAVFYLALQVIAWYVNSFIVKPNELVREKPYIVFNTTMTRQAYELNEVTQREFPAEATVEAADAANNQATLQNIRLWDWRALQDTLRQIQEIRTYYDFPDIDIDRYNIGGTTRQVMLAARELNVEKLPESSRNWINERLIYTHGYGLTMNPVNGFTPEGLPTLILSNMPVQSTVSSLKVTRPEIYFGELTNTDIYVKTRQQEFNYPQGQSNNLNSYEGNGGIALDSFLRRIIIAVDRDDLAKLPFSDDVNNNSRLMMRRNIRDRVSALAPFLTFDPDPYLVLGDDGRLSWIMDGFTLSDSYPYSTHYHLGNNSINYMRNSVKVVIDAYDGTTTFYVFDSGDPIIAAWRRIFPSMFKDASTMPPGLRTHVRYPEMLLTLQAEVYGLYHMTDAEAFYNREDLWTVATEVTLGVGGEQTTQTMQPNFVLMKLPGEDGEEFVEILPFTPANRNNLIGWIAGRSDGAHYGTSVVYNFPKTKLVDGPLQIEARIDQNAQLSGQLTLWNQQGSHVRRGALLVIPIGRALLYAEPIYLQAERSPMPELRLVVLSLQDRLAYGPTFESAMASLFGGAVSSLAAPSTTAPGSLRGASAASASAQPTADLNALIAEAAKDLADYQRLTAEGKLVEAGQKLEDLKSVLDKLNTRKR
ncbi:MAG: membrane protein [Acidobacteria bacterium]|nr:MAG: membrane protein [Acidobacteriota bacterium]